tara:strand:- start:686 stop:1837 length:1152 start_codon:yes stop_codon:yes gene_type:complete
MLFEEIIGNSSVKKQLIQAVRNNRISHAQLFSGKSGSAKLALALAYAQFLNCLSRNEVDSCGTCSSCLKFNSLSHPDLHLIIPVLKTKEVQRPISDHFIVQWRDFITNNYYGSLNGWIDSFGTENKTGQQGKIYKDEANNIHKKLILKNFEAEYRVVLIWMPEKMNLEVSNKLLKLFEEPPKGTIFLLITENSNQLLPTINSRLQTINITDFTNEDIVNHFVDHNLSLEKAMQLRSLTNADLGKITQILMNKEVELDFFSDFSIWMRLAYKMDIQGISKWVDSLASKGRKHQNLFFSYAIKMIRECLVYNFGSSTLLKNNENEFAFLTKFSLFIHEENSVMIVEKLEESIKAINRNANAKILFFELSLQMVKLLRLKRKFAIK